jgi:hypothetical protein
MFRKSYLNVVKNNAGIDETLQEMIYKVRYYSFKMIVNIADFMKSYILHMTKAV